MKTSIPTLLLASLFATLAGTGCDDVEEVGDDLPSHDESLDDEFRLLVGANITWPRGVPIEVCWNIQSSQTDAGKRNLVRSAIEQSWGRVSGVRFVGWDWCPYAGEQGSERISIHARPGRASASLGKSSSNWIGIDLDAPALRATAIHEFGHSLGFYHEQADPRTPQWCTDNDGDLRANPAGSVPIAYWDATSIMNYCNVHWALGGLSRVDIIGARRYYGDGRYNVEGVDSVFADVTGDGKADALVVNWDGVYMLTSNGSTFTGYRRITSGPFYGGMGTYFADINGDGMSDAIAVNVDGLAVLLSDGTNLTNFQYWTNGAFWGGRGTHFADVNGDGMADAIAVNDDGVYVMESTGHSFTGYRALIPHPFYGARETFFADVTGDGKADGVVINDDHVGVMTSNGTNLVGYSAWSGPFYGSKSTSIADFNGDGKDDLVAVNADNTYVLLSTGSAFASYHAAGTGPFYGDRGTWFADFTGDGKADGIAVGNSTLWAQISTGWLFGSVYASTNGPFYPLL